MNLNFIKEKKKMMIVFNIVLGILVVVGSIYLLYAYKGDNFLILCLSFFSLDVGAIFLLSGIMYIIFNIRGFVNTWYYMGLGTVISTIILVIVGMIFGLDNEDLLLGMPISVSIVIMFCLRDKKEKIIADINGYYDELSDEKKELIEKRADIEQYENSTDEGSIEFEILQLYEKDKNLYLYNYWMAEEGNEKIYFLRNSESSLKEQVIKDNYKRCMIVKATYEDIMMYERYMPQITYELSKMTNKTFLMMVGGAKLCAKEKSVEIYIYYIPNGVKYVYNHIRKLCKKIHMSNITMYSQMDEEWKLFNENIKPNNEIHLKAGIEYFEFMLEETGVDTTEINTVYFYIKIKNIDMIGKVIDILKDGRYQLYAKTIKNKEPYIIVTKETKLTKAVLDATINWIICHIEEDAEITKLEINKEYVDDEIKDGEVYE